MESNPHLELSGLDAMMTANSLEKAIYDKIKRNPQEYDVLCGSISNTLRYVLLLSNLDYSFQEHLNTS